MATRFGASAANAENNVTATAQTTSSRRTKFPLRIAKGFDALDSPAGVRVAPRPGPVRACRGHKPAIIPATGEQRLAIGGCASGYFEELPADMAFSQARASCSSRKTLIWQTSSTSISSMRINP